jgi:hypothetical protein
MIFRNKEKTNFLVRKVKRLPLTSPAVIPEVGAGGRGEESVIRTVEAGGLVS